MANETPNTPGASSPPPTFGITPPAAPPPEQPATPPAVTAPVVEPTQTEKPPEQTPEPTPKPEERVVPEKYDLRLPEDSVLDRRSLERIEAYAKSQKLTQSEAEAFLKTQGEDVYKALEERKAMWLEETKSDREVGGDKLQANVETANRFLDKYMAPELRRELNKTGYGNNVNFMKFILDMAKRNANDVAVIPNQQIVPAQQKSAADLLYGATTSRKQ